MEKNGTDQSTIANSLASSTSCSSNGGKKPRKAATHVQPKRKKHSSTSPINEDTEAGVHITHRAVMSPVCTRRYEDPDTRIQRRSQSRQRDSLLTMLRGFSPKERVFVSTTTDGMRF